MAPTADICILLGILSDAITAATFATSLPGEIIGSSEEVPMLMKLDGANEQITTCRVWRTKKLSKAAQNAPLRSPLDFMSHELYDKLSKNGEDFRVLFALSRYRHCKEIATLMCRALAWCQSQHGMELCLFDEPVENVGLWSQFIDGTTKGEAVTVQPNPRTDYVTNGRTSYLLQVLPANRPNPEKTLSESNLFFSLTGDVFDYPGYMTGGADHPLCTTPFPIPFVMMHGTSGLAIYSSLLCGIEEASEALWDDEAAAPATEDQKRWIAKVWKRFKTNVGPYIASRKEKATVEHAL